MKAQRKAQTSLGAKYAETPRALAFRMISPPEIKPKLPLDDKTPEMTQTRSPLLYGSVVPGSGFSSFHFPENEHTATPANMRIKETLVTAIRQGEKLWEWR